MTNLNQVDIDVRLQKATCCTGTLTTQLVNKIKIGSSDVNCKLQELQVIQGMLKYIMGHVIERSTIATLTISGIATNATITINADGEPISNNLVLSGGTTADRLSIAADIGTFTDSVYTALVDSDGVIQITGPCDWAAITLTTTGSIQEKTTTITEGVCPDNCLTETQVQAMFSYIQKKCNICWQLPQVDYV